MNKILMWLRNISFVIVLVLMLLSFSGLSMIGMTNIDYRLWMTILLILIFIELIILLVRHHECNLDNRYSLLMIGANIIFVIIYLRTMFDTNIVTTYMAVDFDKITDTQYAFLSYNLPMLIFIYSILFIYPLTYIKMKIKKNVK